MIKTKNNSIQYRNYNKKSRNRPSSLILTVNRNNLTEVKPDDQGIPRRYSENSLNTVQQNNFFDDASSNTKGKNDDPKYKVALPNKVDKSSQTSLDIVDVARTFKDTITPGKSIHSEIINVPGRNRSKNTKKHTLPISINTKRHSDHVPIGLDEVTLTQNEEDTTVSINNILDAINDTMINTDSDVSDNELDTSTLVQNYNSNPYYYVRNQNQSLLENKIKPYTSVPNSTNYPLTKSKSDNTILNSNNTFNSLKSQDDIHINSENIHRNINSDTKDPSCEQFITAFDIFENNKAPCNIGNQSHKTLKNHINQQNLKEVNNHLNEHRYQHKVSQETNANRQINTNQSPLEENKAFIINNNNYIESNEEKVIEGSKYYCRMLPGDTRTLPRTTSLGTRLSVFRKSKTLTSRKVSFFCYMYVGTVATQIRKYR